jgi:predicted NAD/FAD-binding protein
VYESGAHVGGHTNTVDVDYQGRGYAIDTGFIVYNDWTYPNFIKLLDELEVPWQPSHMSFNARAPKLLEAGAQAMTLREYLDREGYSKYFIDHYIIPMGAAIWSSRPVDMLHFPARFFVEFFANHGFLSVNDRPTWRVIRGDSRKYVKRLTAPYAARIYLNTPVASIQRQPNRVVLRLKNGTVENFDQVFIACHSDQALKLLSDPSHEEREVLGAIPYQANEALLHTDSSLMPRRRNSH